MNKINSKKGLLLLLLLITVPFLRLYADEGDVYRLELGVGVGSVFGITDGNYKFFGHPSWASTFVARFPLNPRMAIKGQVGIMQLNGNTTNLKDFIPSNPLSLSLNQRDYAFSGNIYDLTALYELHFLPYGYYQDFREFKRLVPYWQIGLGITYSQIGKTVTLNIPVGIGIKWKVAPRVNIGAEWTYHFTPSDKLDGLEGPRGIVSELFRNKDHYSRAMLTITYDLSPKCPNCNKN